MHRAPVQTKDISNGPIVRTLTPIFLRHRQNRQGVGQLAAGLNADDERLLGIRAGKRSEAQETLTLPPQWIESAEEAKENCKCIREKLNQLAKAQQKRLLKVFSDAASPDKDVEQLVKQISTLVRKCEQSIHMVMSRGAPLTCDQDAEFRQNVQRNLATQLQQLSQQFRQSQKDYLAEVQKRQQGSGCDVPPSIIGNRDTTADFSFTESQLQEMEEMEQGASQRNSEISQIAASITDLHTVFKELAVLVIDQGSILDRIDYNIEQVVTQSSEANKQLQKAEESSKSNRAMKCIYLLVIVNIALIIILILKIRH